MNYTSKKAQTGTEYMLMLAGVVTITIVLTVLILDLSSASQNSAQKSWNPFEDFWAKVDIDTPTKEAPVTSSTFNVQFTLRQAAGDYNIFLRNNSTSANVCKYCAPNGNVAGTVTIAKTSFLNSTCTPLSTCTLPSATVYDVVVTARYSNSVVHETDIEKQAIKIP